MNKSTPEVNGVSYVFKRKKDGISKTYPGDWSLAMRAVSFMDLILPDREAGALDHEPIAMRTIGVASLSHDVAEVDIT
jgi:hypothetical protein